MRVLTAVTVLLAAALAAACAAPAKAPAPSPKVSSRAFEATLAPLPPASDFTSAVTNPYYPLKPGAVWVYTGVKDGKPTTDTVTVTGERKTILGIPAVVVKDTLTSGGRLVEDTDDWFAQDKQGNVWYLGEATRDFNPDGSVESTEGSWQAGVDGAKPGIFMPANPTVGQAYKQEFFKGHAEDAFKILSLTAPVTVPFGSFKASMLTEERTPLEPDVVTRKNYVKDIGLVYENDVTGPPENNKLVEHRP